MTKTYTIVDTASDSFGSWVTKTNNLITDMNQVIVTSDFDGNAGSTSGNVAVVGILSANVGAFESLRGGTRTLSAALPITSDVVFTGSTLTASANLVLSGNTTMSSGRTLSVYGVTLLGNTVTVNTSSTFSVSAANTTITSADGKIALNGSAISLNGNTTVTNGSLLTANGTNLTSLNATQLTTGMIPDARIASTIARSNITITSPANAGITGGGDLTANRTLVIDGTIIPYLANTQSWSGTNTFANLRNSGHVLPSANNTLNIGSATMLYANMYATLFNGTATSARYADLAEKYLADAVYEIGTVMAVGGVAEVTAADASTAHSVIGVVSEFPAYLMNSDLEGGTAIALKGRVPVKVVGDINKGDRLVPSGTAGRATCDNNDSGRAFAIALEAGSDIVEAIIL